MTHLMKWMAASLLLFCTALAQANNSGLLFNIVETGSPATADIVLCLNGKEAISCQNYQVSATGLSINTTVNHFYPAVGIKVVTPGYQPEGCIPAPNGYCLFSASNSTAAIIQLKPISTGYTVTPSGDGHESFIPSSPQTVNSGETQEFTVTANTGYSLSTIVAGTCPQGSWTGNNYTTGPIVNNCSVIFSATAPTFTVTPSAGANGSISPNTPQTVNYGGSQNFTATPNAGYNISEWTLDGTVYPTCGTNTSCNLTNVTANHTIAVIFSQQTFTVTPSAGANGSITPNTPQTVNYGSSQNFTATPNTGYNISGWTLDGSAYPTCGTNTSCNLTNVTANHTIAVIFSQQTFTVTPSAGTNGSITPNTPQTVNYGSSQNFTATPSTGYNISGWTLDGSAYPTCGTNTSCNLTNVTANHTLAVSFSQQTFTITPSAGANGTISPDTPQTVNYGGSQSFTAAPDTGYNVSGWTLDGSPYAPCGTNTSCTLIIVTSDHTLAVSFSQQTFTVTPSAGANGSISPDMPQTVNYGGSQNFTATPIAGYSVSEWTLDGSAYPTCGTSTSCNLTNVTDNHTIDVEFFAIFPAATGPSSVSAYPGPGSGQVSINWVAPTSIGTGAISGYVVTYGPTSGTSFTTPGCTTASGVLSCTISGLTNGTTYRLAVRTKTTLSGVDEIGTPSYSRSVTPSNSLTVSQSILAVSALGGGPPRIVTVLNNSSSPVTLNATISTSSFLPALPSGTTVTNSICTSGRTLNANGGFCNITITPGTTASSNCTTGIAPTPSVATVTTSSGLSTTVSVVVLGYGCQYQGGYVFAIDDTTSVFGSIGGKVVAIVDQAVQSSTTWSPGSATDSIWGIDETSTTTAPSPSAAPAQLQLGQLNCNGGTEGACNSNNLITFPGYGNATTYAAGICAQPLTGSSNTACTGGVACHTNWYLPSLCEMSIFTTGPPHCPSNTPNMSSNLQILTGSCSLGNCLIGNYWGSTEASLDTLGSAWAVTFNGAGFDVPAINPKSSVYGIRCARTLTT